MRRRIFGTIREEKQEDRENYNKEFRNFYFPHYIIRVVKWNRMRCTGHVVRMGEMRNAYKILVEKHE
jgi:hypothetical protein